MTPTFTSKGKTQMTSNLTEEAKKLPVDERIALVEEIWDSIAEVTAASN